MNYNLTILAGRVGQEPVVKVHEESGRKSAQFSLATNQKRKNGEKIAHWHKIVVWNKLADLAEKAIKTGMCLFIQGTVLYYEWEHEGKKGKSTKIQADRLWILNLKKREHEEELDIEEYEGNNTPSSESTKKEEEELPF